MSNSGNIAATAVRIIELARELPANLRGEAAALPLDKMQDDQLLARTKEGDQKAFEELVLRHQRQVFNLAYRVMGNAAEAEELAQDVFVKVYQNAAKFRGDAKVSTWMYRITVNLSLNRKAYLKRRNWDRNRSMDQPYDNGEDEYTPEYAADGPTPEDEVGDRQLLKILEARMEQLPEDMRLVLVMRDLQQLSYEEIAETLKIKIGTVKSRLHRARSELAALITDLRP